VRSLAVVSAGLSLPSSTRLLADRLATAVVGALPSGSVEIALIEVREHAHDVVNNLLTGFPSPALGAAVDSVAAADGLIAVTPIFNASYSGLFKSFFDVFEESALLDKPVLLGATGGTARHSLALEHAVRPMFAHLRASVVPTSVFAAPEDWAGAAVGPGAAAGGNGAGPSGALARRIERAGRELAEQMSRRESRPQRDPFDLPITFDRLLAGDQ
jgi:FMN reductase